MPQGLARASLVDPIPLPRQIGAGGEGGNVLPLSNTQRDAIRRAQGNACALCGKEMHRNNVPKGERMPPDIETEEHVVPKSLQGSDEFGNIVLAHFSCNFEKGDRPPTDAEVATLRDIMSKVDRQVLLDSVRIRVAHLGNRLGGHRKAAQKALSTLSPFLDVDTVMEALGVNPSAHRLKLARTAPVQHPAATAPTRLVAKPAPATRQRKPLPNRKRRSGHFPLLAFVVAAIAVTFWIATFVYASLSGKPLGTMDARLIGAIHLALVFGAFNRIAAPRLTKMVTWCFLFGGIAMMIPPPVELAAAWNLPLADTTARIAERATSWGASGLLILGWLVSILTQIARRSEKPAPLKEPAPAIERTPPPALEALQS